MRKQADKWVKNLEQDELIRYKQDLVLFKKTGTTPSLNYYFAKEGLENIKESKRLLKIVLAKYPFLENISSQQYIDLILKINREKQEKLSTAKVENEQCETCMEGCS
ncbi:hypothetical protein [Thermoflexibacter ruber]|uniref:Uncharacterized protein n=1 Tax=Thermoflexibacter ruber TaxID=1003 RepID=A0A1I2G206_9BACT|nr:hypothetical protein [Thermoflexibacter ruber]SFF11123.1 hypothetical protein SAMN04488541_101635 [Thermoflexibacter ruber]